MRCPRGGPASRTLGAENAGDLARVPAVRRAWQSMTGGALRRQDATYCWSCFTERSRRAVDGPFGTANTSSLVLQHQGPLPGLKFRESSVRHPQ